MSLIATSWQNIKHWWHGTESKYEVSIDQYPKEKVVIGIGGSTKISAHVTTSSPELFIKWQKVESHGLKNIQTDSIKYSGSSCSMPTPELIIHDVDITDAGVYQLSVTTVTGTFFGPIVRLNVFGDPVVSLPKEESNYLRYYLLCQKIATESVRCYFTRTIPEPTLASHLNTHKSDLKSSYWKCTNDQIAVLFPVAPEIAKSSNFDFTLLYKLIRNTITPVSTPTCGWGSKPLPTDIKEEDDIERIRHNRNQLAHNTKFQLNDSDFNNLWTDLSQCFFTRLEDIQKCSRCKTATYCSRQCQQLNWRIHKQISKYAEERLKLDSLSFISFSCMQVSIWSLLCYGCEMCRCKAIYPGNVNSLSITCGDGIQRCP